MNKIYIVTLRTGEYEDKIIYDMCAFSKESSAEKFVEAVNQALNEKGVLNNGSKFYDFENPFTFEKQEYHLDTNGGKAYYHRLKFKE